MAQRDADPPRPWLITMSSSCYEYGSSLRFSFSETLPCRMARVLSLSLSLSLSFPPPLSPFTYFYFSPSLCLSILSSPERPSTSVRPLSRARGLHYELKGPTPRNVLQCIQYSMLCGSASRPRPAGRGRACRPPCPTDIIFLRETFLNAIACYEISRVFS